MAQYTPITEEQAKLAGLMTPGEADFEVVKAEDRTSQNGNPYLNLQLAVWDSEGRKRTIFDTLMYNGEMAYKLRHFCYAAGIGHIYESGNINPESMPGKSGRCKIICADDRRSGEKVNKVQDYVVAESTKDTRNYQQAKTDAAAPARQQDREKNAAQERSVAMQQAWSKYRAMVAKDNPGATDTDVAELWKSSLAAYFPGKSVPGGIGASEWLQFAADRFVKKQAEPFCATAAEGGPGVPADDIPFTPNLA